MNSSEISEKLKTTDEPLSKPEDYGGNMFCMAYDVGSRDNPAMLKIYSEPDAKKEKATRDPEFDRVNWLTITVFGFEIINHDGSTIYTLEYSKEKSSVFRAAFAPSHQFHTFLDICIVANQKIDLILDLLKQSIAQSGKRTSPILDITRENSESTINIIDMLCNYVPPSMIEKFPKNGLTKMAITVKDIDESTGKSSSERDFFLKNTLRGFGRNKRKKRTRRKRKTRKTKKTKKEKRYR
jgi:hypothetical protein